MNVLVWQWGRRGAGPRFAACLAKALEGRPGVNVSLSLCRDAEIMASADHPSCDMPVRTYRGKISFLLRLLSISLALPLLVKRLRQLRPDLAICAMPGPLDLVMAAALRLVRARVVIVVHEAESHPGDGFPAQMRLQRMLCRTADGLASLSRHVGGQLRQQGLVGGKRPLLAFTHPPFAFDLPETGEGRAPGPKRLLFFGRLLPYKGLDMLSAALETLPSSDEIELRVVGFGPESPELEKLRVCRSVTVENRWVPETEIGALLAWSDALILPYREASQSGVAAAALAAGRLVIATRVGGLREQLAGAPQVVFCEPDPASLARAIHLWWDLPLARSEPTDVAAAWREAAAGLMAEIALAVPVRPQRPSQSTAWSPARKQKHLA